MNPVEGHIIGTKKPCEICGKPISVLKGPRAVHMKKAHGDLPMEQDLNRSLAIQKKDKPEIKPITMPRADDMKTPQAKRLLEMALAADEERQKAPEAYVDMLQLDERKELVRVYAPDMMEEGSEWVPYYGDKTKMDVDASRGRIPVPNEHGEHITHMGDPLYRMRREFSEQEIMATALQSRKRVAGSGQTTTERAGATRTALADLKEDEDIGNNVDESVERTVIHI